LPRPLISFIVLVLDSVCISHRTILIRNWHEPMVIRIYPTPLPIGSSPMSKWSPARRGE
jgi:hypothetical protein